MLPDLYDSYITCNLVKPNNYVTRGHHLRLFEKHVHYDLREYQFGNRIISNWNSLPAYVITAYSIGLFEIVLIDSGEIKHVYLIIKPT